MPEVPTLATRASHERTSGPTDVDCARRCQRTGTLRGSAQAEHGQVAIAGQGFGVEDGPQRHLRCAPGRPVVSLVGQCLMKQPGSRPSAAAVLARLDRLDDPRASLPGLQDLDTANHAIGRRLDEHERPLAVERRESERFNQLFEDAQHQWIQLSDAFVEAITASVDVGASRYGSGQWQLRIRPAEIEFTGCFGAQRVGPALPFTLIAGAFVSITIPRGIDRYKGRSHGLWYGDLQTEADFGWYETAFMSARGTPYRDEETRWPSTRLVGWRGLRRHR